MEFLTNTQRQVLLAVGQSELGRQVYFTGGTLLTFQYLQHRRSLDLDFFSDNLLDDFFVARTTRTIFEQVGATDVRYVKFPSRWQYFLKINGEDLKFDIAYFPFPAVGKRLQLPEFHLTADSLRDIVVNKVHACFERDAPRDAFDLYMIMKKKKWTLVELLRDVERKFGVQIDLVHLTARLIEAVEKLDELRPLFIGQPPNPADLRAFFQMNANRYLRRRLK